MSVENLQNTLAAGGVVLFDGGFGALVRERSGGEVSTNLPLWATHAQFTPEGREVAAGIHDDYFAAGAQVVISGTFRAQERTFQRYAALNGGQPFDWDGETDPATLSRRSIVSAGGLAIAARDRARTAGSGLRLVAGSLGSLEDCYTPADTPSLKELEAEHEEYVASLVASGVDFLAIETMPTVREAIAAAKAAQQAGIPYGISFWSENGGVGKHETFADAVRALNRARLNPLYLGANCVNLDEVAAGAVINLREVADGRPIAISPNGDGDPRRDGWQYGNGHDRYFVEETKRLIDLGAQVIGGCCGTTPDTIRGVAELIGQNAA